MKWLLIPKLLKRIHYLCGFPCSVTCVGVQYRHDTYDYNQSLHFLNLCSTLTCLCFVYVSMSVLHNTNITPILVTSQFSSMWDSNHLLYHGPFF